MADELLDPDPDRWGRLLASKGVTLDKRDKILFRSLVMFSSLAVLVFPCRRSLMIAVTCLFGLTVQSAAQTARDGTLNAISKLCGLNDPSGIAAQAALQGSWLLQETHWPNFEAPARSIVRLVLPTTDEIVIERRMAQGQLRQFRTEYYARSGSDLVPKLQSIADGGCNIGSARAIRQGDTPWVYMDQLDRDLQTVRWTETLQAPWPEGVDTGGVRVALVDSGLAYDLPDFAGRLARGSDGTPLGYDYWDLDPWPYDGDTSRGPFFPIRHGTTVASILVREAPAAALIPYKYPRPDLDRMADLVRRAALDNVRILAMPLGSNRADDWQAFSGALRDTDILAIVSAGNDGRDIDLKPVYPAALPLENIIVVTSSDEFGRLARGSNWGAQSVDIMLPAENLDVTDFRGATGSASGSSYAVPRLAAIAARILANEPDLKMSELKKRMFDLAKPSPFERQDAVAVGWIANPLADN